MLRKEYFVRGIILFLLALPLVLIPLSFSRYPDVVLYEAPGVTLADIDEYSDELGVAARLSNQVYITNPLYLEAMEIPFLIGSPYDTSAFDRGDQVIVVSGSYALAHFFTYDIIGESITVGKENYRVCGVFDDREYESFEEKSAGIDLSEMQFIPYTSIVGWQARKAESCIAAQELSPEATEVLSRTKAEDLTNYKTGLWRTSVMMVCVVLFLHGIVMTACSYKKLQIRTYAYMLLFVVSAITFVILWGSMGADAIPPSGRVWDVEYYGDLMVSKIQYVLNGQASVMERIYRMDTLKLLFCGTVFFVIYLCKTSICHDVKGEIYREITGSF